ncbi:unnamed protein product [Mytilus coruscus]|uniref:Uncharacterized protein n=1 Tax=Mytilus coruscus TaxID=42192 RepID=A0A6J8AR75_MYTCO|nr:unnamed protein product [Mytilus coruscus]
MMELSAEERITTALNTLRNDLIELRNTDIKLLIQLLNIHDTIQSLLKNRTMSRTQSCYNCLTNNNKLGSIPSLKLETPILRQQSMPSFCNLSSSCSSLADSLPVNNMFYLAESDEDISETPEISENMLTAIQSEATDVQKYEDILKFSVKEWKSTQSVEICLETHLSCESFQNNLY